MSLWEFERGGEVVNVDPFDPLFVHVGGAIDLVVDAAVASVGVVHLYGDWLHPYLASRAFEPVFEAWWHPFPGPYLYYLERRPVPAPFRALIDFVKAGSGQTRSQLQQPWLSL